jgi:hypothetical protein
MDGAMTFSEAGIAKDNTCECCRLGIAFAGAGRPVVLFRNIFGASVRDHAVTTFADPTTPGPIYRVSVDDWGTDVCPHHGPSLSIGDDGTYHVTWFTDGRAPGRPPRVQGHKVRVRVRQTTNKKTVGPRATTRVKSATCRADFCGQR